MSKKIFIDAGGHKGESVIGAKNRWPEIEVHSFEPNPLLWKFLEILPTTVHREAVADYDGEIDFYTGKYSMSATTTKGRYQRQGHLMVDYEHPQKVPCINLGRWIKENFKKSDYIILKLNIEGGEYKIIDSMLKDGSIDYINEFFIHFHSTKYEIASEEDDIQMIIKLKDHGIDTHMWHPHAQVKRFGEYMCQIWSEKDKKYEDKKMQLTWKEKL